MEKQYKVRIVEMDEEIIVSARSPQKAYDYAQEEAKSMFTPAPNFDELTIGVLEVKA